MAIAPASPNPGSAVTYNPSNPYNVGVSGTGNFTGPSMPTTPAPTPSPTTAPTPTPAPAPAPTTSTTPAPGSNPLYAQPGETQAQYEARLGATTGGAPGTGFTPNPTGDPTLSAEDALAKSQGYNSWADMEAQLSAPSESDTDLYNAAYSAAGLDTLSSEITSKQNDLNTATGNINDNPWLDEADRVGRVKTLTDMATADIKNLQDEYNTKLKSVNQLVTEESNSEKTTAAANAKKLSDLEAQAKQQVTDQTKAATPPKTIKGATGATYQWDPSTNSFKQILPGKTAGTTSSGNVSTNSAISSMNSEIQSLLNSTKSDGTPYSKDGYINPQDWNTALQAWNAEGLSTSSFISNFKRYANPNDTYQGITKTKAAAAPASPVIPGISLA